MMKKEYAHLAASAAKPGEAIERIKEIISILRRECPWDKKQTHETLRGCMIEEAYEVVEAIDNKDRDNLREELGDVLLQVVFHSNLSEENGNFDLTDVINDDSYNHRPQSRKAVASKGSEQYLIRSESAYSHYHRSCRRLDICQHEIHSYLRIPFHIPEIQYQRYAVYED